MKKTFLIALLTLGVSLVLPGASAQDVALRANIPFQFTVAGASMPAGAYLISSPSSNLIRIQSVDGAAATTLTTRHNYQDPGRKSKLVFKRYGDLYFFHTVLSPVTAHLNVDLPTSKAEKRIRSGEAKITKVEQVLLAAN
jgi:hypothetical protein